jgi:hypothetical protein
MPTSADRVAARVLKAMAYDRATFRAKVREHVGGAWLEFYKARLAEKNGQTKWVRHWKTEVKTLLERSLVAALLYPIKGFKDRSKALAAELAELAKADSGYRRTAENTVLRDYGLRRLGVHLDDQDAEDFWKLVNLAAEPALNHKDRREGSL